MAAVHPYLDNDGKDNGKSSGKAPSAFADLDDLLDRAVRFGSQVGGEVLGSISNVLRDAAGKRSTPPDQLAVYQRKLQGRLRSGQGGFMALCVLGWVFDALFLIATITMLALSEAAPATGMLAEYRPVFGVLAAVFTPLAALFGGLGFWGGLRASFYGRLLRYLKVMRGWTGALAQLARDTLVSTRKARKDLIRAVSAGLLGNAYYDAGQDILYLDGSLYRAPVQQPEPAPQAQAAPESDQEAFLRRGTEFLRYLHSCQGYLGEAADEELAAIQRACGAILGFVRGHPDQLPRVRRFDEYYLPTTRKLLDTALGVAGAETENAQVIRRDITGILHTLDLAYTRLYDTLLQEVSLDISTEIDTLEAMLSQDGLMHDFASDFGAGAASQQNNKE